MESEIVLAYTFISGIAIGYAISLILEIRNTRNMWKKLVVGLDDFDIKCINEEYAKRKKILNE